jgi:hypothetical protein
LNSQLGRSAMDSPLGSPLGIVATAPAEKKRYKVPLTHSQRESSAELKPCGDRT